MMRKKPTGKELKLKTSYKPPKRRKEIIK